MQSVKEQIHYHIWGYTWDQIHYRGQVRSQVSNQIDRILTQCWTQTIDLLRSQHDH
jgi:hypothetical protein